MILAAADCMICGLDHALKERSRELRGALQKMSPITDPRYAVLFADLVAVDGDLRMLHGRVRR